MARQIVSIESVLPTAGSDVMTFVSASGKRMRVVEIAVNGRGSTSASQLFMMGRSSGGSGFSAALSGGKYSNSDSDAMASTIWSGASAQPTISGGAEAIGFNSLGGPNRWSPQNGAFECRNGEMLSLRASSGITWQACSVSAVIDEDY